MPSESPASSRHPELLGRPWLVVLGVLAGLCAEACDGKSWVLGENVSQGQHDGTAGAGGSAGDIWLERALALDSVELIESIADPDVDQDDPTLSVDQLEFYFCAKRDDGVGHEDIWMARRDDVEQDWQPPVLVEAASSSARETAAAIAPDGLTLWFASDRDAENEGDMDVWSVSRASRDLAWQTPVHMAELSGPTDDLPRSPALGWPFLPLVIETSDDSYDIFLVPHSKDGFGAITPVVGVNTKAAEGDPTFSPDGLLMIFASNRDEPNGDLYAAVRPNAVASFGEAIALDALNTDEEESDPWLAPDGRLLVFSSKRSGKRAIYRATVSP